MRVQGWVGGSVSGWVGGWSYFLEVLPCQMAPNAVFKNHVTRNTMERSDVLVCPVSTFDTHTNTRKPASHTGHGFLYTEAHSAFRAAALVCMFQSCSNHAFG